MKTLILTRNILAGALAALWLVSLTGCAIGGGAKARKVVTTIKPNGDQVTEDFRSSTLPWIAWGDARLAMDRMKVSNTDKTQSIGFSGFETETSATNVAPILKSAGGLIGEAASAFMKSQTGL
jgi:hypothetical protein